MTACGGRGILLGAGRRRSSGGRGSGGGGRAVVLTEVPHRLVDALAQAKVRRPAVRTEKPHTGSSFSRTHTRRTHAGAGGSKGTRNRSYWRISLAREMSGLRLRGSSDTASWNTILVSGLTELRM